MIQTGSVKSNTTGTLTKLIQNGIEVEDDDPIIQKQNVVNHRIDRSGKVIETLGREQ